MELRHHRFPQRQAFTLLVVAQLRAGSGEQTVCRGRKVHGAGLRRGCEGRLGQVARGACSQMLCAYNVMKRR